MGSPRLEDGESVDGDIIPGAQDIYSQARECKALFVKYLKTPRAYGRQVSEC
jgi:hypothetical protein